MKVNQGLINTSDYRAYMSNITSKASETVKEKSDKTLASSTNGISLNDQMVKQDSSSIQKSVKSEKSKNETMTIIRTIGP